jgi:hypothetical protein
MAAIKDIAPIFAKATEEYLNRGQTENMVCMSDPTLSWMVSKAIDRKACGKKFKCRVSTLRNDSFAGYGPYEQKKFAPTKGWHDLEFEMREHRATAQACLQEIEYACNEGTFGSLMSDLTTTMVDGARMSMNQIINNGEGNALTAYGLSIIIGDAYSTKKDGSANVEIGGLSRADCPWLQSIIKRPGWSFPSWSRTDPNKPWTYTHSTLTVNAAGNVTGGPGTNLAGGNLAAVVGNPYTGAPVNPADEKTWWQPLSLDLIKCMILELRRCKGSWNGVMQMGPDLYKEYMALKEAHGCCGYQDPLNAGTAQSLTSDPIFGVPVLMDFDAPPGLIRFLTTDGDALRMRVNPNQWMNGTANWMEPYDQNAMYTCLQAWFQLYSCNPRMLGQIERVAHKPSTV